MSPSLLNPYFLLGTAILILLVRVSGGQHRTNVGAIGSLLLLSIASPWSLMLVLAVVAVVVWPSYRLNVVGRTSAIAARRALPFIAAVVLLTGFMAIFKVAQRVQATSNSLTRVTEIFGFSYFLFRALNFLVVQHLTKLEEPRPLRLLYYLAFPTTFTSGPIQRYLDFRAQTDSGPPLETSQLYEGLYRVVRGFFRKLVLAFALDGIVTHFLGLPELTMVHSILIITALYLYFYFDFAGYSDIAIGLGLALGIRVPENFRRPFLSSSLTEFWRNWHITLVDWLREHVFIPLGGMRAGRAKAGALALLIMILCGMWHGLTTSFFLWGLWHGLHMLLESWIGLRPIPRASQHGLKYWAMVGWTNVRVALGALLFLPAGDDVVRVLRGLIP